MKFTFTALALILSVTAMNATYRYAGGDISLLPEYEKAGAQYKTHDGEPIAELLPYLRDEGMNAMRVRLFVNPENDKTDPNVCQDLDYIIPLCRRIVDNGFDLMLDFHYSDTWADPAKQWTPKAWQGLSDEQLCQKINEYTGEVLSTLKANGVTPAFIQPGNEISYGMLWGAEGTPDKDLKKALMGSDANWERFGKLLNQAILACRRECPDAKIIIHTERVANVGVQDNFYRQMQRLGVDYDIIGLSYYPYFHGSMSVLDKAITSLEQNFPSKEIMIVETGFPYKWEVPGTTEKVDYPYSDAGQDQFAKDLVDMLESHDKVNGLFWWWLEYNAYNTTLTGWYNAPLFDSTTGRACAALKTIGSFTDGNTGIPALTDDTAAEGEVWHDLLGRRIAAPSAPGIYIRNRRKILITE